MYVASAHTYRDDQLNDNIELERATFCSAPVYTITIKDSDTHPYFLGMPSLESLLKNESIIVKYLERMELKIVEVQATFQDIFGKCVAEDIDVLKLASSPEADSILTEIAINFADYFNHCTKMLK